MTGMTTTHFEETPASPWHESPAPEPEEQRPVREPVFNAPWQTVVIVVLIVGGYAVQTLFPADAVISAFAFSPANLAPGRWETLITAIFLHGGWPHALMNGAFALAFSAPVARFFGPKLEGFLLFMAFYLACGVLANLGYALVNLGSPALIVGASGAVSGLMGAAARLMGGDGQRPGPLFSRAVVAMGGGWIVVNLLFAVLGGGFFPGTGGAGVAWEAHLAGFAVGALLITPFGWFVPRR
jgi:membrane associated rhomboid family serine protease